jgi:hypothetical protein
VTLADVGARHHDFGAERLQVLDLFAAHLVRDDEQRPIALQRADQREREARVAGGRLDDRSAGLQRRRRRSAASIIDEAIRSLIEPPGFWLSSFA